MEKMRMGKLLVCWLLLCGLSLLAGCREEEKGQAGAPREELVYASTKDIRDINPHLYGGEMAAQGMVFEPLVINTAEGVRPWLAESWEISPDGRVYTFHLRRGVTFSDGTPFDAEAVRLNMDAIIANRLRHAWLDMINEIERPEVVDSHTWRLVLKHPYYPTLIELGLLRPFRFISPSCFIDGQTRNGVRGLVGTGPWILKEHKENQYALFTANPSYWGEKPRLQAVRWKVMPDHQAILLALHKGDVDLVFGADGDMLNLDNFDAIRREGRYAAGRSPGPAVCGGQGRHRLHHPQRFRDRGPQPAGLHGGLLRPAAGGARP